MAKLSVCDRQLAYFMALGGIEAPDLVSLQSSVLCTFQIKLKLPTIADLSYEVSAILKQYSLQWTNAPSSRIWIKLKILFMRVYFQLNDLFSA